MIEYPKHLYKCPGAHAGNDGVTFDYRIVTDKDDEDDAVAEGWKPFAVAIEAPKKDPTKPEEPVPSLPEPDLNAPPTREELEIRAKELNVKFHHKTGDKKLAELIEQAEQALGG